MTAPLAPADIAPGAVRAVIGRRGRGRPAPLVRTAPRPRRAARLGDEGRGDPHAAGAPMRLAAGPAAAAR